MPLNRRFLLRLGGLAGIGSMSAGAVEGMSPICPLDVQAGHLIKKSVGNAAETLLRLSLARLPELRKFPRKDPVELRRTLAAGGPLRIVYREFPLDARAFAAAMIVKEAGDPYFAALDPLFAEQRNWSPQRDPGPIYRNVAAQVGFYRTSARCWTDFPATRSRTIQGASRDNFAEYLAHLDVRQHSEATIAHRTTVVQSIYRFLIGEGLAGPAGLVVTPQFS